LCVGIRVGFLLSAELAIPTKLTNEITTADNKDINFLIIFPFLNILSN